MFLSVHSLSNEQYWLLIVVVYVLTCAKAGQTYQPNDPNNIAAQGVSLADSIMGAYNVRFANVPTSNSGNGGVQPSHVSPLLGAMPSVLDMVNQISQRVANSAPAPSAPPPKPPAPRR